MRPQPPAGAAPDTHDLAVLAALLDSTRNLAASLQQCADDGPAAGSAAQRDLALQEELASGWARQPLEVIDRRGRQLIDLAADHVWALRGLLDPRWPAAARRTIARVAMEASAGAWWLYDPQLDTRARLARGWTLALGDLGPPSGGGPRRALAGESLQAVVDAGERLGMRPLGRPPRAFDEPPPPTGALAARMLAASPAGGANAWREHAGEVVAALLAPPPAGSGAAAGGSATGGRASSVTVSLVLYVETFARWLAYHGWEETQWQRWGHHVVRVVTGQGAGGGPSGLRPRSGSRRRGS